MVDIARLLGAWLETCALGFLCAWEHPFSASRPCLASCSAIHLGTTTKVWRHLVGCSPVALEDSDGVRKDSYGVWTSIALELGVV